MNNVNCYRRDVMYLYFSKKYVRGWLFDMGFINELTGKLIVSCQALPDEPLHSSEIMGKMALAAEMGGADGIRANSAADIQAIKEEVSLPVVGIVKRDYIDSEVFITATLKEVKELISAGVEMMAIDATDRARPGDISLAELVAYVKKQAPEIELMADISTMEDAIRAEELGFDCVSTTLVGYTKETEGKALYDDQFNMIRQLKKSISIPVVAEGKLHTPELAKNAISAGADFVVIGSAITRPQLITEKFNEAIRN